MNGFQEWASRHCTIFGLFDPRQMEMVKLWRPIFEGAGFVADDLNAATDRLATNAPPKYPADHREALLQQLRAQRAVALRKEEDEQPDRGRCVLCGGSGLVTVPDLRGVRAGQWVGVLFCGRAQFYTAAVTCSCYRGRSIRCTSRDGKELTLSLADYEMANPGWRIQLGQRRREQVAEAEARPGPPCPTLDAVIERLRSLQRQPGEDREYAF